MKQRAFEKVYRAFACQDEADRAERAYFHSLTPEARVEIALEAHRLIYGDAATQRLEKVCRVTELERR